MFYLQYYYELKAELKAKGEKHFSTQATMLFVQTTLLFVRSNYPKKSKTLQNVQAWRQRTNLV